MSAYKVEICGVNTAKLPVLKDEEKEALFTRIKQGDTAAREEYIKGNLRLVLSIIRRFSGHTDNIDDLFQIGCIGLMKSIANFDPTMGVKFSTYAVPVSTLCRKSLKKKLDLPDLSLEYYYTYKSIATFLSVIVICLTTVLTTVCCS